MWRTSSDDRCSWCIDLHYPDVSANIGRIGAGAMYDVYVEEARTISVGLYGAFFASEKTNDTLHLGGFGNPKLERSAQMEGFSVGGRVEQAWAAASFKAFGGYRQENVNRSSVWSDDFFAGSITAINHKAIYTGFEFGVGAEVDMLKIFKGYGVVAPETGKGWEVTLGGDFIFSRVSFGHQMLKGKELVAMLHIKRSF